MDGKIFYTNIIDKNLEPIYPDEISYTGYWKLMHSCVNQEYIFWTWKASKENIDL